MPLWLSWESVRLKFPIAQGPWFESEWRHSFWAPWPKSKQFFLAPLSLLAFTIGHNRLSLDVRRSLLERIWSFTGVGRFFSLWLLQLSSVIHKLSLKGGERLQVSERLGSRNFTVFITFCNTNSKGFTIFSPPIPRFHPDLPVHLSYFPPPK